MTGPSKIRTAVFPVAGLGTRFLPATKSIPKEVLTLVDRPLIQYAVDEARAAGITNFVFVTSRGKSALEDYFDTAPLLEQALRAKGKDALLAEVERTALPSGAISYVRQREALGLGHAVWCARHQVGDEPFAVLLPDDVIAAERPCLQQMVEAWESVGHRDASIVATMPVGPSETTSYGMLEIAEDHGRLVRATGLVEKPAPENAPSDLAVVGRYILSPRIMAELDGLAAGAGGEIQLTDAIASRAAAGDPIFGYRFAGERFDCGTKGGFLRAQFAFAMEREDLGAELRAFLQERLGLPIAAE